jgi:chromosome segregation ATPase
MICCVSPAGVNFYESLNALRYANRARNIQNKPVVNRDPTLVMIDDLKKLIQNLASELLEVRKRSMSASPDGSFTLTELEAMLANGTMTPKRPSIQDGESSPKRPQRRNTAFDMVSAQSVMATTRSFSLPTSNSPQNVPAGGNSPKRKESSKEITKLKSRATETDFELKRMTEQMKRVKSEASELSERIILMQSERDFYHIKYSDLRPDDAISFYKDNRSPLTVETDGEKGKVTDLISGYLREIEALKRQVAEKQQMKSSQFSNLHAFDSGALELESELTSNVARVIAQTEKHLLLEAKKLKSKGKAANSSEGTTTRAIAALDDGNESDDDPNLASGESSPMCGAEKKNPFADSQIEEDDLAYQRRQKMMTAEVAELGESIDLKEQLLDQLKNSHYQYGVMKTFYEQKLTALNLEMDEKQSERDRLLFELQHLEHNTNKSEAAVRQQQEQEKKLKGQLQKREDELRQMKKRQEELTNLSRVQTRYTAQVAKLECDIESMKRQKVDLSKSLQVEKKRHYTLLNEKAREIDRLKRDLQASTGEAKRLGKDKQKAEERTREVR